jgi:hypothetical protein
MWIENNGDPHERERVRIGEGERERESQVSTVFCIFISYVEF